MKKRKNDDTALGFVVLVILGLIFLPVAGLFLIGNKDPEKQTLGWILLIVGIVLLVAIGIG